MRRIGLAVVLIACSCAPYAALAQRQAPAVIGFLSSRSPGESASVVEAFRQGLNDAGYAEGQSVVIEFRWANGQYDRLQEMASELVSRQVALIIAAGGDRPVLAAKAATSTIPIVFTGSDFPVRLGLVASLNRPGGNVTGASLFTSELQGKKLALLHELVPKARLLAMLVNPTNPSTATAIEDVQKAARAIKQQILFLKASSDDDITSAFEAVARQRAGGLLVAQDPYFLSRREHLVGLAARHGIPAIYEFREFVSAGGLMSYGNRITDNYRLAGNYAGRILKGAKPADLPVQQPTKFELLINLKTAKALALTIPQPLLLRADEVIE
jgi:ABC-type uncharacterized transport system substrate-binding protein